MSDVRLFCNIEKIDKENRTVGGWATTEALDKQSEIVDYGASKNAFSEWSGNIREQHDNSRAVGKAIEIIPDDTRKAVWVKAYISKGAQATWEKVLDGTLKGYSIGGNTLDKAVQIVKDGSGASRQITRITKYRLNELSLVDNPANPESAFTLVKRASDGNLYQTELVEDIQKTVITDSDSMLESEIREHREKADGLARKVRTNEELEKLHDEDFGVIRKYVSPQGKQVKERLLPMPDKVHAHSVIRKLGDYPLTSEEREQVHAKAKGILGNSHSEDECKLCKSQTGGDSQDMDKMTATKLTEEIGKLCSSIDGLLKQFEGAHKPVAGAKETPKQEGENPTDTTVSQSSPEEAGAADGVKTQEGEPVPAKKEVGASDTEKASNPATTSAQTQEGQPVPVGTSPAPATVTAKEQVPAQSSPEKSGDPDSKEVKTQEPQPVPAAKAADAVVEDGAEVLEKGTSTDIKKLSDTVAELRKELDTLKRQPLPRKMAATKVEKSYDEPTEGDTIQKDYNEVREWITKNPGKQLPPELARKKDAVLNKMLDAKFGGETRKVM